VSTTGTPEMTDCTLTAQVRIEAHSMPFLRDPHNRLDF
jgi:hypothetical protein